MKVGDKVRLKKEQYSPFMRPIPGGCIGEVVQLDTGDNGVVVKFDGYITYSDFEKEFGEGAYWLFKDDVELIKEYNEGMNIQEAYQALVDGKRVKYVEYNTEVYLNHGDIVWDEYDYDSIVPIHEDTIKLGAFEIIEESADEYRYYRLQEGEFQPINEDLYNDIVEACDLQEDFFTNIANDELLEVYKTPKNHFDIIKKVKKEA